MFNNLIFKSGISVVLFFTFFFNIQAQNVKVHIVKKGETLKDIATENRMAPSDIIKFNKNINFNKELKPNQQILIPLRDDTSSDTYDYRRVTQKSKNIKYHTVGNKETLFSISKKYHSNIDSIIKLNNIKDSIIKIGQTLVIPILENNRSINFIHSSQYSFYKVKPKQGKFSIASEYGITIKELERLNPEIKKTTLKVGQVLIVPKYCAIPPKDINDKNYFYHLVKPKETLFSLSQKYHISIAEIKKMNPFLKDGLKAGQRIKILNGVNEISHVENNNELDNNIQINEEEKPQVYSNLLNSLNTRKSFRVAILLPFNLKSLQSNEQKCEMLTKHSVLDYYAGIKLAIDSLKNYGMNISYDVFDTQGSGWVTDKIISSIDFLKYDFVVGPLKEQNIEKVARILELKKIPQVVHKYKGYKKFNNLIVISPNDLKFENQIIHFINKKTEKKNIVLIYDSSKQQKVTGLLKKFNSTPKLVKGKKTRHGYSVYLDDISRKMDKNKPNYVVVLSDNEPFIFTVLSSLNSLRNNYNITLLTLNDKRLYEDATNDRTNTFLSNLNYHFPSKMIRLIDPELKKSFIKEYKSIPSFAAVNGFDSTFDILLRAGNADNLFEGLQKIGKTKQTSKVFLYRHRPEEGFKNQGSVILKLNKDLQLEVVE